MTTYDDRISRAAYDMVIEAKDAEITALTARVEHYKRACIATSNEVTRVLGEALYGPTPEGAPGDVWAVHTPESIADEAASEIATLRAENERMRGEIITYQDAHTTGTEIIDELRAKVEALEACVPNEGVVSFIAEMLDDDAKRTGLNTNAYPWKSAVEWLNRVSAARKGGSDAE